MNRCDNSGMQSHAWNRALSLSRYVRLVAKSFRVCEIVKQREESWPLSLSALAHNRTRITTRGGEKAPVHNSHAWWTLLVFVRFMLCHATRSSLSIDACVRRSAPSEGGGVGEAILEENSCPIYLSGIIDRPYRVGREDIGWWAKEGRKGNACIWIFCNSGFFEIYIYVILYYMYNIYYMLYYIYMLILIQELIILFFKKL